MTHASLRGLLAGVLLLAAHAAWTAPTTLRYRCSMPDGSVRVTAQDLSEMFESASLHCVAVEAEAASPEAPPPPPPLQASRAIVEVPPDSLLATLTVVDPVAQPAAGPGHAGPGAFANLIREASSRHGVDPALVSALIYVESRFHADARSSKGALGLMQIMPATGARYGVAAAGSLLEPAVNLDVGTRYVRDLLQMFAGRLDLAIAAYNAGEGAVAKYGYRVPPFAETQDYVDQVLSIYSAPIRR